MRTLKRSRWFLIIALFALIAAACGGGTTDETTAAPAATEAPATTEAMTETEAPTTEAMTETEAPATTDAMEEPMAMDGAVCEVTDTGGVDDKSFNQLAFLGAQLAEEEFGYEARVLESSAETDFEPNINSFLNAGDCALIVTVGFALGEATATAAGANPEQNFAIVDFAYDPAIDNVQGLVFAIDQAAFLAGYIAADQTESGVVGTFGGVNIPPVSDFMEGFTVGVAYYNEANGTDVTVLGWDTATQEGLFTGNFESLDDGRAFAENLADEGADIILPVAGPVGLGAAALVQERGIRLIGVDADWTETAPEFADVILTSILKKIDIAVLDAARAAHDGTTGPLLVSTLESGGVGVAPVTNPLKADTGLDAALADLIAGIISGDIATKSG